MCNEVEGDVWLFESMKRYHHMSMFDFGLHITHIERTDRDHVCVVAHYEHLQQDDIMEVILPRKFFVPEAQEGLERDVDLKIERGALATSPIFQTKAVPNKKKLITSEEDKFGVSVYDLSSESNDGIISKLHHYSCAHFVPQFSFNGGNNILMTTTNKKPCTIMDMTTGQTIQTLNVKSTRREECKVQPEYISKNVCAICTKNGGVIEVTDTRSYEETVVIHSSLDLDVKDQPIWLLSCPYQNSPMIQDNNSAINFACISSGGDFLAYDMRNPKKPFCVGLIGNNNHKATAHLAFKTTPDFSRFSVTGFDEKVNIYEIDDAGTLTSMFIHDGHVIENDGYTYNFVKSHLFLKNDMLLSADSCKSVQCWQFIPSRSSP